MTIVLSILMVISAIVLIITVLLQSSESDGMSALAGSSSSESFFGKNKATTLEGKLALATKASATVFVVLAVIMLAI